MGATGRYIHAPESTTAIAYSNAYDAAKVIALDLFATAPAISYSAGARVRLSGLYILGAIGGGATKLTVKAYDNSAGTGMAIIPETEATLTTAITGTNGTAAYRIETDAKMPENHTLYIFAKTDAGTYTTSRTAIVWEE